MLRLTARAEFDRCWPWLEASLEVAAFVDKAGKPWPSHTKEHVWQRLVSGRSFLWPGKNCAIVTEFHTTPTGIKAHHTWLAGGELDEIVAMMPKIEAWGRKQGAHRQTGSGRRGWLRAFDGYHEVGVRKEKNLVDWLHGPAEESSSEMG